MSDHTKEPVKAHWLKLRGKYQGCIPIQPIGCNGEFVGPELVLIPPGRSDIQQANARRITACWNACIGVDTETLEKIAAGEMDGSEILELARVKQQRDELLEALNELCRLKAYKDTLGKTADYLRDQPLAWERARAIIAKVEG